MRFEWDDTKAESNARKHGITFKEAITVFADPCLLFTEDARHLKEKKENGLSEKQKMVQLLSLFLRCEVSKSGLSVQEKRQKGRVSDMSQETEFPFEKARRVTPEENQKFRSAIADQFGITLKKRGRPIKEESEKYEPVSIRLHPKVLAWAREEANKQGVGYQTVINEVLLQQIHQ